MSHIPRVTASAAFDLYRTGRLPAMPNAAVDAITRHALDRLRGLARFRILTRAQAAAFLDQGDPGQLGFISRIVKEVGRAVENVGNVVGDAAKIVAPVVSQTGIPIISPLVGGTIGAAGAALTGGSSATIANTGGAAAGGVYYATQMQPGYQVALPQAGYPGYGAPVVPQERMIAGIPERYIPWIAGGFVLLLLTGK